MKINKLSAIIALSLASSVAMAEPYQAELQGAYADADGDDQINILGAWYFNSVNTSGHPLREAAFLERTSFVKLDYTYTDSASIDVSDLDVIEGGVIDAGDTDEVELSVGYYIPNTMFFVGAHYSYVSFDGGSNNDWGVTLGLSPIDGLLITTRYDNDPGYDLNLQAKYVTTLAGGNAINVEAAYFDGGDGDDTISVGGDFYIDRTWSVGAWIEDTSDTGFGIRTEKFFFDTFSVAGSYFTIDSADTFEIRATLRF